MAAGRQRHRRAGASSRSDDLADLAQRNLSHVRAALKSPIPIEREIDAALDIKQWPPAEARRSFCTIELEIGGLGGMLAPVMTPGDALTPAARQHVGNLPDRDLAVRAGAKVPGFGESRAVFDEPLGKQHIGKDRIE